MVGGISWTSEAWNTSDAERILEARRDVTMLAIFRDPEHKVLTNVYSGSVDRFRSASYGRPDPYAQDVSAVCTIKEAKWQPIRHSWGGGIHEVRVRSGFKEGILIS